MKEEREREEGEEGEETDVKTVVECESFGSASGRGSFICS